MELKVTVDGYVRVVCGVSEETTCQDIVIALARAIGRAGRFSLLEKWRNQERSLPPWEKPFVVLQKWGQYASDVQFVLQQTDCATAINKKANESVDKSGVLSNDISRAQNLSPISPVQDYSVKRSLTFSGTVYSSQDKSKPLRSHGRHILPLSSVPSQSSTASSQTSSQSYHHYNQVPKQPHYLVNSTPHYQQSKPEPPPSNVHHTQQQRQQQQQQQQIFQNKHPYIQKPISSIKPQPKPRNLPLKSNNEKQPVRTIGTVSPIQSYSQSSGTTKTDLTSRILHNNVSRFNSQNRAANVVEIPKDNNYYSKNNTSNINPNNNTTTNNNNNNSHTHIHMLKDFNNDVDKVLSEKSSYNELKNNPNIGDDMSKALGSVHSRGSNKNILHNNRILSDIEEYDLESNYPLSTTVSPMPNQTMEYYRIQGHNYVDQQSARDRDPQFLYQLIEQQHNEIEFKKSLIKDLEQEIVSTEELFENRKEIAAFESLSNSYADELREYEHENHWQGIVDDELHKENMLKSELANHRQKLDSVHDQLQQVDCKIADLSKQLELEVNKFEDEINTIQKKIKEESAEDGKCEEMLNDLNEQLNQVESEIREKQSKENELIDRVKDFNLKDLEKTSVGTNKPPDTGTAVLKLLEKQHQFVRQNNGSKDVVGCRTSPENIVPTEDNSVLSGEGVWV